jgi:hypothetical protein
MDFTNLFYSGIKLAVQAMQIGASMKQTNQVFDSILGKDVIESAYRQPNVTPPTFDQNIANALDRMSAAATYIPPRGAPPTIPTADPAEVYRADDNSPAPIMPRLAEPENAIELDDVEIGFDDPLPIMPRLQTPEETATLDEVNPNQSVELDDIEIDINDLPEMVAQQERAPPEVDPPESAQAVELDDIEVDINDLPQQVAEKQRAPEPVFKEPTNLNNVLPTMPEMERPSSRGNRSRSDSETGGKPIVAKELDSGAIVFTIKHQDDPKPTPPVERAAEPAPPPPSAAPKQESRNEFQERFMARVQAIQDEQAKIQAERDKQQPPMQDKEAAAKAIHADHDAQFVIRAEALLNRIKADTQKIKDFNSAPAPTFEEPKAAVPQAAAPTPPAVEPQPVPVPLAPPHVEVTRVEVEEQKAFQAAANELGGIDLDVPEIKIDTSFQDAANELGGIDLDTPEPIQKVTIEAPTVAAPPPPLTTIEVAKEEPKASPVVVDMISTIKPVPASEAKAQTAGRTGMMNHPPSKMDIMLEAINKHAGGGWDKGPGEGHNVQFTNKGVEAFEVKSDRMVVQDHSSENMEAMLVGFKAAYGNDKKPSINCPPELEQKWKDVAAKLNVQIELKGPVPSAEQAAAKTPAAPKQEAAVEMERRGPGM